MTVVVRERAARVLVVDDDQDIRDLLDMVLADEGYDVVTAENGDEALHVVLANGIDLILLDMRMPVLDGWGFARLYSQNPPQGHPVPIVVITAAQDAKLWAQQINAAGYLAKPFNIVGLKAAVHAFLGSS